MLRLFDNADDSDSDLNLKTDTDFAKNYDKWRQKEELHKLQAKYGNESSDTESSSEDDEGDEINEEFEKDFFKTLSCLKNKDPRIYDKKIQFFNNQNEAENVPKLLTKKKKDQPVYLKDYERKLILEKGGQFSDEEEENPETQSSTYVKEQQKLKENLKEALNNIDDNEEDVEWGGMFKTRQKTAEEKKKEEEDYLQWLAGQTEHLKDENAENDLKPLKDFWTNPKLDEGEKFLRDYVLKKKFLDSENTDYIPTYEEVIHDSDEDLSEDEKAVSTQEEFEHKYNFRFEEPDQEFIKRYPRTMENSLRQKDDKRKIKRSERKERKVKEKQQKMEEIKQLQVLKKKEIEEKIDKLKEITGNAEVSFNVGDLEDDFDPELHDKRMKALFDDQFYEGPEGEQKPEFPELDEELELENWDYWHGNEENENEKTALNEADEHHCEDEDFNMDCDYDPSNTQKELIENSKRRKKRKRKSKFVQVLSQTKPVFDPNDKTYQEYLDEYYKLDCEDIIGDLPCRFKYREVVPNSFGLSIEEILTAKDKELNRWCSLKKAIQHRPDHVEKYDVIAFEKKAKNIDLKRKYIPSLFIEEKTEDNVFPSTSSEGNSGTNSKGASKKKKSKQKNENEESNDKTNEKHQQSNIEDNNNINTIDTSNKKHKQKRENKIINKNDTPKEHKQNITEDHVDINETSKKKQKRKKKHEEISDKINEDDIPKKKSKQDNSEDKSNIKVKAVNKKKHKQNNKNAEDIGISDARLAAYGINPKKFKNKLKYGNK
ncbi:hypothetical protein ILUMI_10041 [Ignelater luminosus]|uniref:Protein KRI1 homolog n=1 Tax=Ignelater luminosus TaxID=2038154 RepID=A0A8K0GFD1_IGNLU|nr:hypothetical protein ILUMI_10041 [Ignelater luminosus]